MKSFLEGTEEYQDLTDPYFEYIVENETIMRPKTGQQVTINYKVQLAKNRCEGNHVDQGQDFKFVLGDGEVIPGMEWAINEMKKGETIFAYIPWRMAYGESGMPPKIPAKSDLVFEIELKGFGKKKVAAT
jgi:FK506-binding protein 4/5